MHRLTLVVFTVAALVFVNASYAEETANPLDVAVGEVAWMGTTVSSNDEWIELYNNTGGATDLTGWTLSALVGSWLGYTANFRLAKRRRCEPCHAAKNAGTYTGPKLK